MSSKDMSWDDACAQEACGAVIDGINFNLHPHINKYDWMQREYHRMVQKHAQLFYEERMKKDFIKRFGGKTDDSQAK